MRYKLYTLLVLLLIGGRVYSQSKDIPADYYKASTIPDSLKKDANAVVRYSAIDVTVKAAGHAIVKRHIITTILNEKAKDEAIIDLGYDKKYLNVNTAEMLVYGADGKLIKKYHRSDMYDRAAYHDALTIITDYRMVGTEHTIVSYPVTIEKIEEIERNGYLDLNEWNIQQSEIAIQNSSYHIMVNPSLGFRYKDKNTSIEPKKSTQNDMDSYLWEVKNVPAYKLEDDALSWQVFPRIAFATNSFEYGGLPGDISSWQSYGKWQWGLNADVCSLSPTREEEIRQMTAGIKTDKEKVKFLYDYLQHNMRYVNVILGIGGLKPASANFVDQKKYGDCKGLSNYMTAMLKAVNIPSYFSYVNSGENQEPSDPNFPYDRFDHIIVCVPLKGDTTWLECTSSKQPFGKLGTFTENRNALLITENGGKLVNTPQSTLQDNLFNSQVHLTLQPDGSAKATLKIAASGEYRNQYLSLAEQKTDEQKEYLIRYLNIKQPSVFDLKPAGDANGVKEVEVEMEYDKFCDIMSGDKQFYRPRVFDLWRITVPVLEKRKSDYYFEHPLQKTCTTTIDLPAGFEVESMPANASLKFSYGNYDVSYVYDAAKNQIISTAKFNLTNYVIPAAKYNEMQVYMDNIAKVQNKKLVIRKKA